MSSDHASFLRSPRSVDTPSSLNPGTRFDWGRPTCDVLVRGNVGEFSCIVNVVQYQCDIPGVVHHIGDSVRDAAKVLTLVQVLLKNIELAMKIHGVSIVRVLPLLWCIGLEVPKAADQKGGASHLPRQP